MLMLRTLPAAVLALLLLPWRLEAAPPRARPQGNPWVVILGSRPRPADAQALLEALQERRQSGLQWLKPAEGFPKVVDSASLPGLAPGLNVLVLGVCGTKETALAARARVVPMVRDAYVKQLTGPAPLSCPTSTPLKSRLPKDAVRLVSVPFKQDKALVLSLYKINERSVMDCTTNDLRVRLEYGREVLAEETLPGDCKGVCTSGQKQEGEARVAEIQERIEKGEGSTSELDYNFVSCISLTPEFLGVLGGFDRPVFFVTSEGLGHHDVVSDTIHAVGVACGKISLSDDQQEPGFRTFSTKVFTRAEARPSTREDPDEGSVDVVSLEKPLDAKAGDPPVWTKVAEFSEWECHLSLLLEE